MEEVQVEEAREELEMEEMMMKLTIRGEELEMTQRTSPTRRTKTIMLKIAESLWMIWKRTLKTKEKEKRKRLKDNELELL